jgi:hypothetical protein
VWRDFFIDLTRKVDSMPIKARLRPLHRRRRRDDDRC